MAQAASKLQVQVEREYLGFSPVFYILSTDLSDRRDAYPTIYIVILTGETPILLLIPI